MAENIMLNLGIGIDGEQAEADASKVYEELSDVLEKTLEIDVDSSDLDALGRAIKEANGQITIVKDNLTGFATTLSASWEDANGQLIKYIQNLNAVKIEGTNDYKYDVANSSYSVQNKGTYKEDLAYIKEYYDIRSKIMGLDPKEDSLWVELLNKELSQLEPQINRIKDEINSIGTTDSSKVQGLFEAIEAGEKKVEEAYAKSFDTEKMSEYKAAVNNLKQAIDDLYSNQKKLISTKLSPDSEQYKNLTTNVEEAKDSFVSAFNALQKFKIAQNELTTNTSVKDGITTITLSYEGQDEALVKLIEHLKQKNQIQNQAVSKSKDELLDEEKIDSAVESLKRLNEAKLEYTKMKLEGSSASDLEKQSSVIKKLESDLESLKQVQLSNNKAVEEDSRYRSQQSTEYGNFNQRVKQLNEEMRDSARSVGQLDDSMASNLANTIKMAVSYQTLERAMSEVVETTKELDAAMTDIQIVTQMSDSQAQNLMVEYSNIAKQLGTTTKEVAASSSEWLRQGETIADTSELVKASTTLATVGAMDSAEATTALTAAINGYQMQASDAMSIVDQLTTLDLRFAASAGGIATALSKVASVASQSGVGLEKLESILTVTQDQTQQSAETIGNAWNSIFQRMNNIAAGKDIDDMGESLNNVDKVLSSVGLSLRDESGQIRDLGDVLDEVAAQWNTYTRNQQNQISTAK